MGEQVLCSAPGEAAVIEVDVALLKGAQLSFLLVLLDGIQRLLCGDLELLPVHTNISGDRSVCNESRSE